MWLSEEMPVVTLRFMTSPSLTTKTTLSSLVLGLPTGVEGGGGVGPFRLGESDGGGCGALAERTVTAWMGTAMTSALDSVATDTCALMPESTVPVGGRSAGG